MLRVCEMFVHPRTGSHTHIFLRMTVSPRIFEGVVSIIRRTKALARSSFQSLASAAHRVMNI